jgi:hypothetical protein
MIGTSWLAQSFAIAETSSVLRGRTTTFGKRFSSV